MSSSYSTIPKVRMIDVFDGRLEKYGIREVIRPDTRASLRYLTDGEHVRSFDEWGGGISWSRYHGPIVGAICDEFQVHEIISEQDPRFWGFESDEEMEARIEEFEQEEKKKFLENLRDRLRGEPNPYSPATLNLHRKLELACGLIQQDPCLSENEELLWARLEGAWERALEEDRRKDPFEDDIPDIDAALVRF